MLIISFNLSYFIEFYLSGFKLDAHPLTIATAATLYHRFFKEADQEGYDCYVSQIFSETKNNSQVSFAL